jgi:hypothetical protein
MHPLQRMTGNSSTPTALRCSPMTSAQGSNHSGLIETCVETIVVILEEIVPLDPNRPAVKTGLLRCIPLMICAVSTATIDLLHIPVAGIEEKNRPVMHQLVHAVVEKPSRLHVFLARCSNLHKFLDQEHIKPRIPIMEG